MLLGLGLITFMRQLHRLLKEYASYYHYWRSHLLLQKDAPLSRERESAQPWHHSQRPTRWTPSPMMDRRSRPANCRLPDQEGTGERECGRQRSDASHLPPLGERTLTKNAQFNRVRQMASKAKQVSYSLARRLRLYRRLSPRDTLAERGGRTHRQIRRAPRSIAPGGRFDMPTCGIVLLALSMGVVLAESWDDEALIRELRSGGYNIYFRHAETDWSQSDRVHMPGDWTSCDPTRIRQLSNHGRENARRIGEALRAIALPIGNVLSSPYCRAVETAQLFDVGTVLTTDHIMNMRVANYFGGPAAVVQRARSRLAQQPAAGSNTLLVAHGNLAREATSVYPGEAGALIIKPLPGGSFRVVGTLSPSDWERLAERANVAHPSGSQPKERRR